MNCQDHIVEHLAVAGCRPNHDAIGLPARGESDPSVARISRATRRSDAKGAVGRTMYAIVAPDTDVDGARRLAERILDDPTKASTDWVAGLFAETDLEGSPATASDFLSRATEAYRRAQAAEPANRILGYSPLTN